MTPFNAIFVCGFTPAMASAARASRLASVVGVVRALQRCARARGAVFSLGLGATENSLENTRVYNLFRPGTRDGRC